MLLLKQCKAVWVEQAVETVLNSVNSVLGGATSIWWYSYLIFVTDTTDGALVFQFGCRKTKTPETLLNGLVHFKKGVRIYWISLDLLVPRLFVCKNGDDVRIVSYHGSWSSGLIDLWERRRVNPATLIWSLCSIDDKTVKQKYLFSTVLNYHVAQIQEEGESSFACSRENEVE